MNYRTEWLSACFSTAAPTRRFTVHAVARDGEGRDIGTYSHDVALMCADDYAKRGFSGCLYDAETGEITDEF